MMISRIKDQSQAACCKGCKYSEWNGAHGLYGAWECAHPENGAPDKSPRLAVLIFEPGKPTVCDVPAQRVV